MVCLCAYLVKLSQATLLQQLANFVDFCIETVSFRESVKRIVACSRQARAKSVDSPMCSRGAQDALCQM